jgi:hypothetical protein
MYPCAQCKRRDRRGADHDRDRSRKRSMRRVMEEVAARFRSHDRRDVQSRRIVERELDAAAAAGELYATIGVSTACASAASSA